MTYRNHQLIFFAGALAVSAYAQPATPPAAGPVKVDSSDRVWAVGPAPAMTDNPVSPAHVRIVKQGLDNSRNGDGNAHGIACFHRYKIEPGANGLLRTRLSRQDIKQFHDFDVDGDGKTENDVVACHPFDLSEENPMTPAAPFYDTSVGTQRFYGGATIYHANKKESGFSEDGINGGEEGPNNQPRRNWTFFHESYEIDSPYRMYFLALWQKFDFLNGGKDCRVSFDSHSELRHLVMRYYMGIDGFRWVVRNGDLFYISEEVYEWADQVPGQTGGKIHSIHPANARWSEFKPQAPYKIDFNAKAAKFEKRTFDNVTAVGWLMFKDTLVSGYVGLKWYAFEADALVHRPSRPSETVVMAAIRPSNPEIPPFYMSTCEVPYELWRKVHRLARSNTFAGPRGFGFDGLGAMGSMGWPDDKGGYPSHSQQEPVTDISYLDAILWCNALSVQETKTPCYYIDSEFKEPFREIERNRFFWSAERSVIYVNWSADGYRLPTSAEWVVALGAQKQEGSRKKSETTRPVGSGVPNEAGLHDMLGNVWEYVWTMDNLLDPANFDRLTVLGGDFRGGANPEKSSASAYGDEPFKGSPCIGFRPVRREAGLKKPLMQLPEKDFCAPFWTITKDTKTAIDTNRQIKPIVEVVPMPIGNFSLGKCELTYAQWKPVYDWAVAHGYFFDFGGDMGSMAYWGFGKDWKPAGHGSDEPVTDISQFDAVVWCNALSELEGLEPVYYGDEGMTKPFKQSYVFRPPQLLLGEIAALQNSMGKKGSAHAGTWPAVYAKKTSNGYRMPTEAEFTALMRHDGKKVFPWGNEEKSILDLGWIADNSGLTTHPVGRKKPTSLGLYDFFGNVSELSGDAVFNEGNGYADRMGGSFMDPSQNMLQSMIPEQSLGLPYPDVGFRVLKQNTK